MSKILCLDDGNILTKEHIVRINETNKIEIVEVQRCKSGNNTKHWKVRFTYRGNTHEKDLAGFLSIVSSTSEEHFTDTSAILSIVLSTSSQTIPSSLLTLFPNIARSAENMAVSSPL